MKDLSKERFRRNDRIIELQNFFKLSTYAFAKLIGCNKAQKIYNIVNKRNGVTDDILELIMRTELFNKVSKDWLYYGIGDRFTSKDLNDIPVPKSRQNIESENKELIEKISDLENENEILKAKLDSIDKIVETQAKLIAALENKK